MSYLKPVLTILFVSSFLLFSNAFPLRELNHEDICDTEIKIPQITNGLQKNLSVVAMTGSGCCGDLCSEFDPPLIGSACTQYQIDFAKPETGSGCASFSGFEYLGDEYCIGGQINTIDGTPVEGATVEIIANIYNFPKTISSSDNGVYAFTCNPSGFYYRIRPIKRINVEEFVSINDVFAVYLHLVRVLPFTSAYQYIAGDVNLDSQVSYSDLIEIASIVLNVNDKYSSDLSWVFIDAQSNVDNMFPWPFISYRDVLLFDENRMKENFTGIKLGDVTGNSFQALPQVNLNKNNSKKSLLYEDQLISPGQVFSVDLLFQEGETPDIIQSTLEWSDLELVHIDNYGMDTENQLFRKKDTTLDLIWFKTPKNESQRFLTLEFKSKTQGKISDKLSLSQSKSMAYNLGATIESTPLVLQSQSGTLENEDIIIYQNQPNPFSYETSISYILPAKMEVRHFLYSSTGRLLYENIGYGIEGLNQLTLDLTSLDFYGVMYFIMETDGQRITRKMVRTH